MVPYTFAPYNPMDEEQPILPPKSAGERFRYMKVTFPNGTEFKGYNIFDVYIRSLQFIGFDKVNKVSYWSKYKRGGAPIVSTTIHKEWGSRYK